MKKRNKTILIIILGMIIISNLPPVYYFIGENYSYQNADKSFTFTEQPGTIQNFKMAELRFESFKLQNSNNINKILFRTFTIKPWKFWEWYQMIFNNERFMLHIMIAVK